MKNRSYILLFGGLLLCCLVLLLVFRFLGDETQKTVQVYQGDTLLTSVDLTKVTEAYDLPITQNGHTNILRISPDGVEMVSADCPDQLCVRQGKIQNSIYPIVCLPNRLRIELVSDQPSEIDAVSGRP